MGQFYQLKNSAARKEIAKHFGITLANLSQILNFKREGPNAEKIRLMAEKKGAILMKPDTEKKERIQILNTKGEVQKTITISKS